MASDYVKQLEAKLKSSRERVRKGREMKHLQSAAPTLFEIIDGEISLEINKGYSDSEPLSYDQYLESHGAVRGIRRIRNLIDAKGVDEVVAAQEVTIITDQLKELKRDKKQQ